MRKLLIAISMLALLTACDKKKDEPEGNAERTVLIYMSAENNLTNWSGYKYADEDLKEIKEGAKSIGNNNLLIYVSKAVKDELPYLLHYRKGELRDSIVIDQEEKLPCDPEVFEKVTRKAFTEYPANSYGLVLWGHATGWEIRNDSIAYTSVTARQKAYGGSNKNNSTSGSGTLWMNIPTMANVLRKVPHLKFIFCDCCQMMCVENAYELRDVTDYLIGSPAEIPAVGAPYNTVVPAMMDKDNFYMTIIDRYYEQKLQSGKKVPLSVVKTSEMQALAYATRTVLKTMDFSSSTYPIMTDLIYYCDYNFYDMNHFILTYASEADYTNWKKAFDNAVVYKKFASRWDTSYHVYFDFDINEQTYGGLSMFVPRYNLRFTDNTTISQMAWYYTAGYSEIGW